MIWRYHGESLCLCFADVAGITLWITHPQFRLHSRAYMFSLFFLYYASSLSFLVYQTSLSYCPCYVEIFMYRFLIFASPEESPPYEHSKHIAVQKSDRTLVYLFSDGWHWWNETDIRSEMNPTSSSSIGHFQVASPLDAAFGMRKMIVKLTFELSPQNQRHFDSELPQTFKAKILDPRR